MGRSETLRQWVRLLQALQTPFRCIRVANADECTFGSGTILLRIAMKLLFTGVASAELHSILPHSKRQNKKALKIQCLYSLFPQYNF